MSILVRDRPGVAIAVTSGGAPARRAVIRWAVRLSRREWRQQLMVLTMLAVAVAATILGAAVATNMPPPSPSAATFGTARALITLPGNDPHLTASIAAIRAGYGPAEVIENQSLSTGQQGGADLRAQDPSGRYGAPMLSLVSGQYPTGPGQVAMTSAFAALYNLRTGGVWHEHGRAWRITGIVMNPANLLDVFALVAPGQITTPTQVTILLGQGGIAASSLPSGATVSYPQLHISGVSPATVVLVVALLGLIFIGLMAVSGFGVMAQRRLRALGMLSALGATKQDVQLVMVAGGAVVGVVATLVGAVIGFAAWLLYVPYLQRATERRIDPANLPWWAIIAGMLLAVLTAVIAARQPARMVTRLPVVAALSGRPAAPKAVQRSAAPGLTLLVLGLCLLALSGGWGGGGGISVFLLAGLTSTVIGGCLLAPLCVAVLATAAGPRAPVAIRIALRDLVRYRARSGAALAAVSFAVFLSVLVCIIASVRFSNVLDYTGANLTASQLIVHTPTGGGLAKAERDGTFGPQLTPAQLAALGGRVDRFAGSLHARYTLPLESASVSLLRLSAGSNNFNGQVYVATPALLRQYGINASQIPAGTDILSSRPGLAGEPRMLMTYGDYATATESPTAPACPAGSCLANPKIVDVAGLPAGTSAPNTVVTMQAVRALRQPITVSGWLIQAAKPLTPAQISAARQLAVANGATIETKSGQLGLTQISDGITVIGILIALGVLAMSVGLIRRESATELRTLIVTGASSRTRRTITGATAGSLAVLGALLGTATGALAGVAWAHSNLSVTFGGIPAVDFIAILIGLPLVAALGGWLLAGREPSAIARQPHE